MNIYFLLLLSLKINTIVYSTIFQSTITLQETGTDFLPANPIELIASYSNLSTLVSCYIQCNMNVRCRTFVSDTTWPFICRLYEGLISTGNIIISSSSTSRVAGVRYDTSFYNLYNQPCDASKPPFDRYLVCTNTLWQCPIGTYSNGLMCLNQVYYQQSCNTNETCRQDIGLYCSLCGQCVCNSTAYWNSTFCVQSTCETSVPTDPTLTALWPFNGDAHDVMNRYNGTLMGNLSFVTGYVGQAMQGLTNTYVLLPHIDFFRRSFTIELWFYLTNANNSLMNLFSECPSGIAAQCLHYGIVSGFKLYMGFFFDDVEGTTSLVINQWYHVALVYDYDLRQRFIYLNGNLETSIVLDPGAAHLYLGQSGNAAIGGIPIFNNYFYGYIDHVSITYRAKIATEILDDASLIAYYSFDCGSTLDSGPNLLHGSASGETSVPGRVNNALEFNSSNAYFQAFGFTALGMFNQSFSISFWMKPQNFIGTLIHLSNQTTGDGWCDSILGFDNSGQLIARIGNLIVYGPVLTLNVWTHIVQIFSVDDGIYLIVNEIIYFASGQVDTTNNPNQPVYITVANRLSANTSCILSPISNGTFVGTIDELRVYNRKIQSSEICALYAL